MALSRARDHLRRFGLDDRVREFVSSSATVEQAARAVGCPPERIAKTLSLNPGGETALIVAAGDAKIDNSRYKARFSTKAKMLGADELAESVSREKESNEG